MVLGYFIIFYRLVQWEYTEKILNDLTPEPPIDLGDFSLYTTPVIYSIL